ncbi:nucleotide-binding protein [Mitsuaria sp. CC2]|uniref:TIR domain-containing protein n=1 Tax=Mitsuaria sp. CC2 TaxID=3029186 RepID=UPI003B8D8C32
MLQRFEGEPGRRLRLEAIAGQKIVGGNRALAEELAERVELLALKAGQSIIEQNGSDNDVYLILSGVLDVVVNGRLIAKRFTGDSVGEMAAVEPTQRRSATIIAFEDSVVAKVTETVLSELGSRYPDLYRCIARELARRLLQRNSFVTQKRDKIRVFIICSVESLKVAQEIQSAFEYDSFVVHRWDNGVFKVANYTLQSLEDEVDRSDFAIAIAHADDLTESRGKQWPSPRDNVIFELGLFMGRLGKARAILMEPRDENVKLPSDLAGITTIPYRFESGSDSAALLAPACNALRKHILSLGPNN